MKTITIIMEEEEEEEEEEKRQSQSLSAAKKKKCRDRMVFMGTKKRWCADATIVVVAAAVAVAGVVGFSCWTHWGRAGPFLENCCS